MKSPSRTENKGSKSSGQEKPLVEIAPYGLSPGLENERPVLIFKAVKSEVTVAVPLSPLDAGISVAQTHQVGTTSSPHQLGLKLLKELGYEVDFCLLKKVKGHHVFVEVFLDKQEESLCIEARADEAISFCLHTGTKFFVSQKLIKQLKILEAEQSKSMKPPVKSFGLDKKKHPYLM